MKSYFDIVGDGGSGILDQVLAQRDAIERNLEGVGSLLAVGSGKGGVGKSTVTLQLSRAMAARGVTCAVLDADLNGPSQAHMSGLAETPLLPGRSGLAMPRTSEGIAFPCRRPNAASMKRKAKIVTASAPKSTPVPIDGTWGVRK